MFSEMWMGVLVLGAAIAAAGGVGFHQGRRPNVDHLHPAWLFRLPWYFFGAATVFFLGLALYSIVAPMGGAAVVIHGFFAAFEAYMCAKYIAAHERCFHARHLLLPALIVAMFVAALHPLSAIALPILSTLAAIVLIVVFIVHLCTPKPSQV